MADRSIYAPPVPIGEFRYNLFYASAQDVKDPITKKSIKIFVEYSQVKAAIIPVGTQFFYIQLGSSNQYNTEAEITHTVYTHWRAETYTYDYLIQYVDLPNGNRQKVTYEIFRATDWMGFRRYNRMDVKELSRILL